MKIVAGTDLKMMRETLCLAQSEVAKSPYISDTAQPATPGRSGKSEKQRHIERLQELIDEIDHLRPLGPDGKHGTLHTEYCGCEDKGHGHWCPSHNCCADSLLALAGGVCPICEHTYKGWRWHGR